MATILNIETSGKTCSVCISKNGEVLEIEESHPDNFVHAEKLNIFIENILHKAGLSLKNIDAVAVSEGPGSYTGLRIGIASAKGFCYALSIPLIAVNSLESLLNCFAVESLSANTVFAPMFDARRMEVYVQLFDANKKSISERKAKVINENSFSEIDQKVIAFGDGADKLVTSELNLSENLELVTDVKISAKGMVEIAHSKYKNQDFADVAYFDPVYLKEFKAG